ncbi:MAG: pyridoxamine 5'-phosphate oxidase family protein [bacterium]|nr:pyridoxamine 5'-phosphate oxidase family protein [bacterium]
MAAMTEEERTQFLSRPRLGMLSPLREDGSPVTVPVCFDGTADVVRMFTSVTSAKRARIAKDPRATLLAVIGFPCCAGFGFVRLFVSLRPV